MLKSVLYAFIATMHVQPVSWLTSEVLSLSIMRWYLVI